MKSFDLDCQHNSHISVFLQSEKAKSEVLKLVIDVLTGSFPDRFQMQGSVLSNKATKETFDTADKDRNPMDIVARLLQVGFTIDAIMRTMIESAALSKRLWEW